MQDHEKLQAEQSLARLTAQLASAYVSNNTISTADVGRLIAEVARQLRAVGEDQQAPAPEKLAPAVSVRRSIGRDHLVCLACGKKQRMLKRHLATRARSYAERLPRDVQPQAGLSDGGPELCRGTARAGPENRSRAAEDAHQERGAGSDEGGGAHQDPAHEGQGCLSPPSEPNFLGGILGPLSDGS